MKLILIQTSEATGGLAGSTNTTLSARLPIIRLTPLMQRSREEANRPIINTLNSVVVGLSEPLLVGQMIGRKTSLIIGRPIGLPIGLIVSRLVNLPAEP